MGTLRKYLLNGAIISSVLSGVSAYRQQRKGPKDWRTYATWVAWGLMLAVSIGTVQVESRELDDPDAKKRPRFGSGPKLGKRKK